MTPDEQASHDEALREWRLRTAEKAQQQEQEDCTHDEHDHGICLYCAKDITDDLVSRAEAASDAAQDR